jgi:hypothetical protein
VAIALAHLERERRKQLQPAALRARLANVDRRALIDRVVELAHDDPALHAALLRLCDEAELRYSSRSRHA